MAAHRYWRATAFEAYGAGDLELSEFHLLAIEVRVDASATLTASVAPDVSGVIANLQDDVLATAARWSAQAVKGLALTWDFGGSTADVDDIRLAGDSEERFPLIVKMQWSNDSTTWTDSKTSAGIIWPGISAKTTVEPGAVPNGAIIALRFDGANGDTSIVDATGRAWVNYGGLTISTAQSKYGGSSAYSGSGTAGAYTPYSSSLELGTDKFLLAFSIYPTSNAPSMEMCGHRTNPDFNDFWFMRRSTSGEIRFYNKTSGSVRVDISGGSTPINTWTKIELTRDGDTFSLYTGDALATSATSSAPMAFPNTPFRVMLGDDSGADGTIGYTDDFLLVKGSSDRISGPIGTIEIARHRVRGRVDPSGALSLGAGPVITYGTPKIALPDYLSIESGSIKDQITGVLGQGIGRVRGTVKTKGSPNQPVHRKVRLIRERDGVVIREMWSNAITGEYDFQWVDEAQTFTVVSYDHLHNYRAVIADNLTPELMP